MICDKVVDLGVEISENLRRSGDESRLVAVAASEVLRGNNRDGISGFGFHQKDFRVIIGEIGSLNNLGDERPEFERLVRGLMVENKVDAADLLSFVMKKRRRRNSSEIEKEVCQTSAMPTWAKIHSRMSAT